MPSALQVDQIWTPKTFRLILLLPEVTLTKLCKSECASSPHPLSSWELGRVRSEMLCQIIFLPKTQISFIWLLSCLQFFLLFLNVIPSSHYTHTLWGKWAIKKMWNINKIKILDLQNNNYSKKAINGILGHRKLATHVTWNSLAKWRGSFHSNFSLCWWL